MNENFNIETLPITDQIKSYFEEINLLVHHLQRLIMSQTKYFYWELILIFSLMDTFSNRPYLNLSYLINLC